nr:histidine kinase dimerization/phospho-acceptor domain-containing protein [Sphingomonas sp. GC_Shp_1]
MDSGFGAQSAWRQLVDLMGRGRVAIDEPGLARLRLLRQTVPIEVRTASARALAFASPPAALVAFFAEDVLAVAAPVLRTAMLPVADWIALLPRLDVQGRALLRHRRDLPDEVIRGLQSFGPADFVLHYDGDDSPVPVAEPSVASPVETPAPPLAVVAPVDPVADLPEPPADTPRSDTPFQSLGDVARGLPMVAEALRHAEPRTAPNGGFHIADVVARIDAFQRQREAEPAAAPSLDRATAFRYETDASGTIRWVDGVSRAALVGASFAHAARQGDVRLDAVIAGALRQRARFSGARLDVGGRSDAAGAWRVSGSPMFDHASGRFTGFCGTARRPRADEDAMPAERKAASDSLRQLVHELRTPINAIAGFAELIEAQLLGPVAPVYRDHAVTIRDQAASLIAAIEDLDTAARIEGKALDLRASVVVLGPVLARIAADLAPLAALRRARIVIHDLGDTSVVTDDRAIERLLSRLLAALISAAGAGELVNVTPVVDGTGRLALTFTRPIALGAGGEEALLSIDADADVEGEGAPLLGTGFALRLARNLATELGGELSFAADVLTLRLPAAQAEVMGQAIN